MELHEATQAKRRSCGCRQDRKTNQFGEAFGLAQGSLILGQSILVLLLE
jgi:hypothetical protein